MKSILFLLCGLCFFLCSCVSTKQYRIAQARNRQLDSLNLAVRADLQNCQAQAKDDAAKRSLLESDIENLNKQISFLKENNTTVLNQLKDLSVISSSQAESIKKSLENIGAKDAYIQNLQQALSRKDSLNMVLVMNLKGALKDVNDQDVEVKVEKGVVFISISDKMLFKSGSYEVGPRAQEVLSKVAQVLNANQQLEFLVEGHTDTVPIKNNCIVDNWDLSTKRATAVVRILQNTYKIDPARMTAGGRSFYVPVATNDTEEGRTANRRTRIVIQPQLDQFFKLLEKKG